MDLPHAARSHNNNQNRAVTQSYTNMQRAFNMNRLFSQSFQGLWLFGLLPPDFMERRLATVRTFLFFGFALGIFVAGRFSTQRLTFRASPFLLECNGNVALVLP